MLTTHYQAFNAHAAEYDACYDSQEGSAIFAMEADCLRPFLHRHKRPYLEMGVGSGRFAQALGIEFGVDPALTLLWMAEFRGVRACSSFYQWHSAAVEPRLDME